MMLSDVPEHAPEHAAEHGAAGSNYIMDHLLAHPVIKLPTVAGIDFTITNHTIMMLLAVLIISAAFLTAFRRQRQVPRGFANLLESMIDYVLKDAIYPNLGRENKQFAPYLLTAFFFILVCNLLGMVPFGAAATGNIGVTMTLALITLIMGQIGGISKFGLKHHFKNLIPSNLPVFIIPLMIPVELMSLVAKHLSLAIRLFANMVGGHITILAIMSLIFMFKSWLVAPLPMVLIIFSSILDILISFIQAYVFTTLSSVYIGSTLAEEH